MREINKAIIHCLDTPEGRKVSVADVDGWHKERGWSGIGYHYLIGLDGQIHIGRPLEQVGAHVKGHNTGSIGIAYVGGADLAMIPKDTRTLYQKESLIILLEYLKLVYPKLTVSGHKDYSSKECPCFDATAEYAAISNH